MNFLERLLERGVKVSLPIIRWRNKPKVENDEDMYLFQTLQKPKEGGPPGSIPGVKTLAPMAEYPIIIKPDVVFKTLKPEIYSIFSIVSSIFGELGKDCILTSGNDGVHKGYEIYRQGQLIPGKVSKHYFDLAVDFRSKHLRDNYQKLVIVQTLKEKLGSNYLVLFENEGRDNEHFHIGWGG